MDKTNVLVCMNQECPEYDKPCEDEPEPFSKCSGCGRPLLWRAS